MPSRAFYVVGVFGTATEVRGIPVRHFVYDSVDGKSLLIRRDAAAPTYCPWVKLKLKVRGDVDVPTCIHRVIRVTQTSISPRIGLNEALQYYLRNLSEQRATQRFVQWRACYPSATTTISCVQDLQMTVPAGMAPDQAQRCRALHAGILRAMASLWLDVDERTRQADESLLCYFGESVLGALQPEQRRQMHRFFFAESPANFWKLFCWPFFVHALRCMPTTTTTTTTTTSSEAELVHLFHVDSMEFCHEENQRGHQYTRVDPRATLDQAPPAWRKSAAGVRTQQMVEVIGQQYRAQVLQGCDIYPLKTAMFVEPPYRALDDHWCCLTADYLQMAACSAWLQQSTQNIWLYDTRRLCMFPEHSQYLLQEVIPEDTTHALLLTTSSTRSEVLSTHTALPWYALTGGLPGDVKVAEGVTSIVIDNAHKTTLCEAVQWIRCHVGVSVTGVRLYVCGDSLAFGCTYLRRQGNLFRDLLCVRAPAVPFVVSRPSRGFHATTAHELRLLQTVRAKVTRNLPAFTVDAFGAKKNDASCGKRALDTFTAQLHSLKLEQGRKGGSSAREIDYQILFLNETDCNTFLEWCQQHGFPRQQNQETASNAWVRCHAVVYMRSTGDSGKVDSVRSTVTHDKKRGENVKKRGVDCRESHIEIEFSRGKRRRSDASVQPSLTIDCSRGEKIQPVSVQTLPLDDGRRHAYTLLQVPADLRELVCALSLTSKRLVFFGQRPREELGELCKCIEQCKSLEAMKAVYRGSSRKVQLAHSDIFASLREQQLKDHGQRVSLFARVFAPSFHCTGRGQHQ